MTKSELLKEILEATTLSKTAAGKANKRHYRNLGTHLRRALASLIEEDHVFLDGWHIQKQYHAKGTSIALYTPASWEKYQSYLTGQGDLDWIT